MTLAICGAPIDWAATGSMLQGVGTIAGAGAVVWAALTGKGTFDEWRKQKLAERKLDQAVLILTAAYKARRALSYVRAAMIWAHELNTAERQLKEKEGWADQADARRKRLVTAQAFYNRINDVKSEREALDECLVMARALFNAELEKSIEKLSNQFWIVKINADSYIDDERELDADFTKKIRYAMYEIPTHGEDRNEVSDAIEASVASIEIICLPFLKTDAPPE